MRVLKPSLWVFFVALLASLCVHLPVYEALGVLAEHILNQPKPQPPSYIDFEMGELPGDPIETLQDAPEPPPEEPLAKLKEPAPKQPKPPPEKAKEPDAPQPQAQPEPVVAVPQKPAVPEPPPQHIDNAQAVTQKSEDPSVPPPDNPKFIAEENRRVEEETVAQLRNMQTDDPEQQAGAQQDPSAADAPGNADETESAQHENQAGDEEAAAPVIADATERPRTGEQAAREASSEPAATEKPVQHAQAGEQARQAEQAEETEELRIEDGSGSFVIRRIKPRQGAGQAQRAASDGQRARDGVIAPTTPGRPNLKLSFSQYEDTFGADSVQEQRERYAEQRRSRAAGQSRDAIWKKFRGAIENYLPKVRPGNQTALNTAASPFAAYLAVVHRQIHVHFADQFLRGLPMAGSPMSDPALVTTLEIVINADGTLETVGVARSSGFLPFDYGAFSSVQKAAPFPAPPKRILSYDGRAYMHWAFHRNERQCGTFNAQPYMLKDPGGPAPAGPADRGEQRPPSGPLLRPGEGELGEVMPLRPTEEGIPQHASAREARALHGQW